MNESLLEALTSVVWYNGYYDDLQKIRKHLDREIPEFGNVPYPDFLPDDADNAIRVIWSILSLMFGNCGCSPRFGWVEKPKEAIAFIDVLCSLDYQEDADNSNNT